MYLFADARRAGPWTVGERNASAIGRWDHPSPVRGFDAAVFFPCSDDSCAAVAANPDDAAGRWPAVTFGIGWSSWALRYERTLRHLASHGFIVLAPTTADHRTAPRAWEYAQSLLGSLQFAAAESARPESLLASRVDASRCGAFGHSMGGGSAIVAAALSGDPAWAASFARTPSWPWGAASLLDYDAANWVRITALVTLSPAPVTAPLSAVAGLRARTLFLLAQDDHFVSPASQRALFDALPAEATPRALALLLGGTHCLLDEPSTPGGGWGLPSSQCEQAVAEPGTYMAPQAQVRRGVGRRACAAVRVLTRRTALLQVHVTRKYVAAYFTATLARGGDGGEEVLRALRADPLVVQLATSDASAAT